MSTGVHGVEWASHHIAALKQSDVAVIWVDIIRGGRGVVAVQRNPDTVNAMVTDHQLAKRVLQGTAVKRSRLPGNLHRQVILSTGVPGDMRVTREFLHIRHPIQGDIHGVVGGMIPITATSGVGPMTPWNRIPVFYGPICCAGKEF
jgi:hypothetical protein